MLNTTIAEPKVAWRHQYDAERDAAEREATNSENFEPSMTQASHAQDADLNVIVQRFGITDGALPPAALDPRYFGDFTDAVDFKTALDRIRVAYENFDRLPATLRTRFNNDPRELYAWVNNPDNLDEAIDLKILSKEAAPRIPKTTDQRRQAEIAALELRVKELQNPVPPPIQTTPPTPATPPTPPK